MECHDLKEKEEKKTTTKKKTKTKNYISFT
jgi:hypothetical protein